VGTLTTHKLGPDYILDYTIIKPKQFYRKFEEIDLRWASKTVYWRKQ